MNGQPTAGRSMSAGVVRVGLFGLLGSGNIGNDASMEAVLGYLKARHPDVVVDAMCGGPDHLMTEYGIDAIPLIWYQRVERRISGRGTIALKLLGKVLDPIRTARWVRGHDVVIIPGMGVLEASLPQRAFGFPYAMFLLCAAGRLFGTKVALVSVGAEVINQRVTRWMFKSAARLAYYRSYRDAQSWEAMRERDGNASRDRVFPDLVFGRSAPPCSDSDDQMVGIGLMDYHGGTGDKQSDNAMRAAYLESMKLFIRWLLANGRRVRLLIGDACDEVLVRELLAGLEQIVPGLDPSTIVAEPVSTYEELTKAMMPVSSVVAIRYHNVICALQLIKPVISVGYASKNYAIMEDAGLVEFCQRANSLDLDLLIKQFAELESRSAELRRTIAISNAEKAQLVEEQFAELTAALFPAVHSQSLR
jgi:polysaccharide pyruvyl transferase WcaK-like protein